MTTLTKNQMARWCRLDLTVPGTITIGEPWRPSWMTNP